MSALFWVVVFATIGGTVALPVDQHWENFKKTYGKKYPNPDTEAYHYSIFQNSLKEINEHNAKFEAGEVTYSMKLIEHSDLPVDQWPFQPNSYVPENFVEDDITEELKEQAPDSIDWREKGYVTPVKTQSCADCYIYGAVGAIESFNKRKTGNLVVFSEQNMRDCLPYKDICKAGLPSDVINYVATSQSGLIDAEKDYPFEQSIEKCKFDKSDAYNTTLHGFKSFSGEDNLKTIVGTVGPVTIAYQIINLTTFRQFKTGVFYDPKCTKDGQTTHILLIVGYGRDEKLGDYWIAKNSWGTHLQDNGYIKLARNRDNNCRIADSCVLPV